MSRTVFRAGALAAIAVATLSACTSSASNGHGTAANRPSVTVDGVPTDTGTSTDTSIPTQVAPTTSGAPTTGTSSTGSGLPKDTCAMAQLTVRLIRGGAVPAQEIALITFTNSSTTTCSMFGYPGVSLRLSGRLLGQPAVRSPVTARTVKLLPGAQAEAQVTDFSSCQGSLSDTVRIYPPNLTAFVDKPFELRACRVEVDPVSPSS
jgi:hypothetical protein